MVLWVARVARFVLVRHTQTGNMYQITMKYTKWPQSISSRCKYTKVFYCKPLSKFTQNMPSGNPVGCFQMTKKMIT
jgi:hypothetical protein